MMKCSRIIIWNLVLVLCYFQYSCKNKDLCFDEDLMNIRKIKNCEKLFKDSIFIENFKFTLPAKKPKNLMEAIYQLDSGLNLYSKHALCICEEVTFHFNLGQKIRNEWVSKCEPRLCDQLFNKLKLKHPDYASGLILGLYKFLITDTDQSILETFNLGQGVDSLQSVELELINIEKAISKTKFNQCGFCPKE